MKTYLDANVFILAVLEKSQKGEHAITILDETARGKRNSIVSALVLDEIMWALIKNEKGFLMDRTIKNIYSLPNCEVVPVSSQAPLEALENVRKYGLKPRDALHLAVMAEHGLNEIASDDAHFDKVPGLKRVKL